MNLVPLWDSLAATVESTSPDDRRTMFDARERLADVTERMVAAAMAEYEQIEAMSESQPWYATPETPLRRRVGLIVRQMFREWTKHVEEVGSRAKRSPSLTHRPVLAHLERLLDNQGRTLAMLNVEYEDVEKRHTGPAVRVSIDEMRARIKKQREAQERAQPKEPVELKEQVA